MLRLRLLWHVALLLSLLSIAAVSASAARVGGSTLAAPAGEPELAARVVVAEPAATARQAEAEAALAATQDAVADMFGWRPSYPFSLYLVATDQGMVDALQRYSGFSAAGAESYRTFYGAFTWRWLDGQPQLALFMNLARLSQQGQLQHALAHEYLHVLQWDWMGASSSAQPPLPYWLLEGMAELYGSRIAGTTVASNRHQAEVDAAQGHFTPLDQLDTLDQWKQHTGTLRDQMGTYGEAYSAVELLDVRQPDLVGRLLQAPDARAGGFDAALAKLSGLSLDQLTARLQDDLLGRPLPDDPSPPPPDGEPPADAADQAAPSSDEAPEPTSEVDSRQSRVDS